MAKNKSTVYLGYDDEEITEKHVSLLNSTLNKIGGTAVSCIALFGVCVQVFDLLFRVKIIDFSEMCSLIRIFFFFIM